MDAVDTTKGRIKIVAVELFTERGYEKTSLREIADRVGITKASLYYHYPSKQALLLDIVEPLLQDWADSVAAAERLAHTPANIRRVLERQIDVMLRHRDATAMFMRDVTAVVTAVAPKLENARQLSVRLCTWLAGPDSSPDQVIRSLAAVEALCAPLSVAASWPELVVNDDEVRRVVLDVAGLVLGLPPAAAAPENAAPVPRTALADSLPPAEPAGGRRLR